MFLRSLQLGFRVSYIVVQEALSDVITFSNLIQTSKGRDKVFSLAQYLISLYEKCMESSNEYGPQVTAGEIESVLLAKFVRQNISSGRSAFKFLKFLDEYRAVKFLLGEGRSKQPNLLAYFLCVVHKTAGMFYYLLHNIVWLANMGAIYRHLIENTLGWRDIKDSFSLLSNVTESVKTMLRLG